MRFFTFICSRISKSAVLVLWLSVIATGLLLAQTSTNTDSLNLGPTNLSLTNGAPVSTDNSLHVTPPPSGTANTTPIKLPSTPTPNPLSTTASSEAIHADLSHDLQVVPYRTPDWNILAAMLSLISIGGFLLYQSGLTRAKNVGHSATLLLVGVVFCLIGYWMGGFAVQTGGVGDEHAALSQVVPTESRNDLDHELGFMAGGHHWGLMGSSGFFLTSNTNASADSMAALFLVQSVMLVIAVSAALGASLERARLLAMAVFAFLIGAVIYPLFANWVWGGGWLAQLGREYGLGHGFVDMAGAGVVHETAGTLALVIALVLGARTGRFGKNPKAIPGHNMPFVLLGTVLLLISWTTTNAFSSDVCPPQFNSGCRAAMNTLLAAAGGLLTSFFLAGWQKRRPDPALLCRGLLGGAISSAGCSPVIDPWAAVVIGGLASLLVQGALTFFEKRRLDDPVGAVATHGVGGIWGVLATGLFANGTTYQGYNGTAGAVCGLLYGGGLHQLAAQVLGAVTGFTVVFVLGYALLLLVQKILGIRVPLTEETEGLDWSQTGALGYQGEVESDSKS